MRYSSVVACLLFSIGTSGCDSPFGIDDSELPLTVTSGTTFEFEAGEFSGSFSVNVPFRFVNGTDQTLTLVHCENDRPVLERRTSDGWAYARGGSFLDCLKITHIESGQVVVDTAEFKWRDPVDGSPALFGRGEMSGTYRLKWSNLWAEFHDYSGGTWGTELPESLIVSNEFQVFER